MKPKSPEIHRKIQQIHLIFSSMKLKTGFFFSCFIYSICFPPLPLGWQIQFRWGKCRIWFCCHVWGGWWRHQWPPRGTRRRHNREPIRIQRLFSLPFPSCHCRGYIWAWGKWIVRISNASGKKNRKNQPNLGEWHKSSPEKLGRILWISNAWNITRKEKSVCFVI